MTYEESCGRIRLDPGNDIAYNNRGNAWSDKGEVYAQNMPTWSNDFGGPLRPDQIEYVSDYMMSWEATAGAPILVEYDAIGSDLTVELPAGDAESGRKLWTKEVLLASGKPAPCSACHSLDGSTGVGPSLQGVGARAGNTAPGLDAAAYIRHAIQAPSEYLVPGETFQANGQSLMPATLGGDMDAQNLADLIAFLLTLQ